MNFLKSKIYWPILVIGVIIVIFFRAFLFEGKLPIPSDTIVGLYHPFRDLYISQYPNGIPFKNFLITDPVRQQYPWRELAVDLLKKGELPLWNPYAMAGYPLLGNLQSAPFYPLNVFFLIMPFSIAWSFLIVLEPLLAGAFLYMYLRNLHIRKEASLLGSISFAFSGFFVAWMEWGTIVHAGLWLPLILLSIDKIFQRSKGRLWSVIFTLSLVFSFLAGHLQIFFYVFILSLGYLLARWLQHGRNKRMLVTFIIYHLSFIILTSVQWIPTIQLIGESARNIDLDWQKDGWFLPWQHLIGFVAPDFFGNPTTLNYWGVWNYGEFTGYIGILPLLLALFALVARRDKKTIFFGAILLLSLVFALPTFLAKLPYSINIPFISTAQPTRLLFLADFSLAILAAFGLDWFLKNRKKVWYPVILIVAILVGLWLFVLVGNSSVSTENLEVANRNLRLPTVIFLASATILIFTNLSMNKMIQIMLLISLFFITAFDLIRFGWKFTPFTDRAYLFPQTEVIHFLQKQEGLFRIMTTDSRILPPNFSTIYRIQTIDGYDPLYLRRYGELIAASERGRPDISPPFGFNRIITPQNYNSKIIDLLGVRYVLSLTEISSPKLTKVFQEGQTRVYENKEVLPRAFFVEEVRVTIDKNEAIAIMYQEDFDFRKTAVVELPVFTVNFSQAKWWENTPISHWSPGMVDILEYSESRIELLTENESAGFLILTDSYYRTWDVYIDGKESELLRANYHFRGVNVPSGKHTVEFTTQLF